MEHDHLKIDCNDLLQAAEENPKAVEVIMQMLIEVDDQLSEVIQSEGESSPLVSTCLRRCRVDAVQFPDA